jgi:hypothetical protein
MSFYVQHDGKQLGPYTEAEVRAQLAAGTISPQDHVWWEGQPDWVVLAQSSLLAPAEPGVTPPPAVAPPPPPAQVVGAPQPTSKLAVWALVCGCLGIVFSVLASIPAIILGHLSLSQIKKNPGMQGHGMALAGLILGYCFTVLLPFISIVAISVLIALGNQVKGTFNTIQAQENTVQSTNSADQSASSSDQTTNAPDQSTNAPAQPTAAPVNTPDQSTNSAAATPATPDQSTNSPPASTNATPASQ